MCNQFKGKSFPTTIAIVGNRCILRGKTYKPIDPNSWNMTKYKASINYDV